jgi:hypothetical protein
MMNTLLRKSWVAAAWCVFLACGLPTGASPIVYVDFGGRTYEETIAANVTYGNEALLSSQIWYGNEGIADVFAQAWAQDADASSFDKMNGWPDWVTSLAGGLMTGPESWQGVSLMGQPGGGKSGGFLTPSSGLNDCPSYGGYCGDFVVASPVPDSSSWAFDGAVLAVLLVAGTMRLQNVAQTKALVPVRVPSRR